MNSTAGRVNVESIGKGDHRYINAMNSRGVSMFNIRAEVSSQIEVVVDRRMNGDEFLEGSHPPETEHGVFSSPEGPV